LTAQLVLNSVVHVMTVNYVLGHEVNTVNWLRMNVCIFYSCVIFII